MATDEAKGVVDRVSADLRRLCNRVAVSREFYRHFPVHLVEKAFLPPSSPLQRTQCRHASIVTLVFRLWCPCFGTKRDYEYLLRWWYGVYSSKWGWTRDTCAFQLAALCPPHRKLDEVSIPIAHSWLFFLATRSTWRQRWA